jgi:hypothetical protein
MKESMAYSKRDTGISHERNRSSDGISHERNKSSDIEIEATQPGGTISKIGGAEDEEKVGWSMNGHTQGGRKA